MAGLRVSLTPEGCAALNAERGVDSSEEEFDTGCFS